MRFKAEVEKLLVGSGSSVGTTTSFVINSNNNLVLGSSDIKVLAATILNRR